MSSAEPVVRYEAEGSAVRLVLNRPERLNAVNQALYAGLLDGMRRAEAERRVRSVVLTGAGRAFCVGADLKAHGEGPPTARDRRAYVRLAQRANRALQRSTKPVIAAVNGHAIGAGLELALSADFIVVAEDAKLRFPEAALGTFVGGGVTYTLPRRVGLVRAKELLLLCRFFSGADAASFGLANEAVPGGEVLERAAVLSQELARMAPRSVGLLKRMLNDAAVRPSAAVLRREAQALRACMETRDWREGVAAFTERREPHFTGE